MIYYKKPVDPKSEKRDVENIKLKLVKINNANAIQYIHMQRLFSVLIHNIGDESIYWNTIVNITYPDNKTVKRPPSITCLCKYVKEIRKKF